MPISVDWVIDTAIGRPAWMNFGRIVGDGCARAWPDRCGPACLDRAKPRAAGEIFRRAALVLDRMRLAMAEADAAGLVGKRQRQRIGGRAGADEEHGDLTLEDLVELLVRPPCRGRCRHRRREAGAVRGQRRRDLRMRACPIVRSKNHVVTDRFRKSQMPRCALRVADVRALVETGGQCRLSRRRLKGQRADLASGS